MCIHTQIYSNAMKILYTHTYIQMHTLIYMSTHNYNRNIKLTNTPPPS